MAVFRRLLTFDEAREAIRREYEPRPLGVEEISLLEGVGRVLAEEIVAALDIPPFSRSTVDGYAVRAEDTFGAGENRPIALKVCGRVNIGEPPRMAVGRGEAAEIVTGAPMPEGADAVVMLEYTERKGGEVFVFGAVAVDENVMGAGSDIRKGETVLRVGEVLGSREIGVLAALGMARVKVYVVPRVVVLSTGHEVTELGEELLPGRVYDINAYSLSAAVVESGGEPVCLGVFPDRLPVLRKAVARGLACADVVLTSGGVSVGPRDVMPKVLGLLGKPGIVVCGIAIKPGKPTTVAAVGGKVVFSLPGHPASALLVFHLFVRPLIEAMAGRKAAEGLEVGAFAGMRLFAAKGRRTFVMVRLRRDGSGRLLAEPGPVSVSGAISTLARADGFVEIPENVQFIDSGEMVRVRLFRNLGGSVC
jgi:putative molybdopterin biosynthesis protein